MCEYRCHSFIDWFIAWEIKQRVLGLSKPKSDVIMLAFFSGASVPAKWIYVNCGVWKGWFVCLVLVVNSGMLLGQQRKSGGFSFSTLKLLFSQTPLPLLSWDPPSPSSKTIAFYEHCVTGWSFSIPFPLLARPLFSWDPATREANLLSILFLSLQDIRSWCQIFKASLPPKLPDDASGFIYLWMLWAFKPRRNGLSLPIKRFQRFLIFYKWHQFYPLKKI